MKVRTFAAVTALALSGAAGASDFGVMESAEAIDPGTYKLLGYPTLQQRSGTDDGGMAFGVGYGLQENWDVEGQVASYGDATYVGADVEWNAWTYGNQRVSFGGGMHGGDFEAGASTVGFDATAIFTLRPMHRLELNAALDAAVDRANVRAGAQPADARFTEDGWYDTYYFVPGVEFQLARNLDLLGEIGLGLNGDSDDYFSAGLSWYFR